MAHSCNFVVGPVLGQYNFFFFFLDAENELICNRVCIVYDCPLCVDKCIMKQG